jgi:hypothetical protein
MFKALAVDGLIIAASCSIFVFRNFLIQQKAPHKYAKKLQQSKCSIFVSIEKIY